MNIKNKIELCSLYDIFDITSNRLNNDSVVWTDISSVGVVAHA